MKQVRTLLFWLILPLSLQMAQGQNGVSDRINEETDRAPSLGALEREAEKAALAGNPYAAMQYYARVLKAEPLRVPSLKGYGEAAIQFAALDSAEMAFQRLVDNKLTAPDGAPILRLAEVKYRMGKYAEARDLYQKFLFSEKPAGATAEMKMEAEERLGDCNWVLGLQENPEVDEESFTLLDTIAINTKEYSEYAPVMVGDTLWFSSNRFLFEKDKEYPKRNLIKVLAATAKDDLLQANTADFNDEKQHIAQVSFSDKGDAMYFSQCGFVGNSANITCQIYRRKRMADGTWGAAEKLPDYINAEGATTTEPSIARAEGDPYETLYFVSDRTGGKGKRDIWATKISGDNFSQPTNLSALNTAGDDVTPSFHTATNTLYYSTDGLQTVGGLDIFKSHWDGKMWSEPAHLGFPINSGANDVYFSLSSNGNTAFMATNRRGDFNKSEEGCCYDIYKVDFVKPKMIAITFNKENQKILPYTTMTLLALGPDGKPAEEIKVNIDSTGSFRFDLLPGKSYVLIGEKERFKSDTVRFSTPKTIWKDEIVQKMYLQPSYVNLIATVYDKETNEPINGATARFFDLGQRLPNGSFVSGKGLGRTDTDPAGNRYDYKLDFEHRYQVVASKVGYTIDSSEVVTTEGLNETKTIETKLFLTRGLAFRAFTINRLTRDTLYNVTYRLIELPTGQRKPGQLDPIGKNYEATIGFEKRYRIIASKEDFSTDSVEFSTNNLPKIDFQSVVQELRIRPLLLPSYLPIPLFFDNDEPDKRTLAQTTAREYRATYVDYIRRKDDFIKLYTEGMSGEERDRNAAEIDTFFERDVRGGWNRLMEFSEVLYEMLTRGDSIEITLKGYASPRAGTQYNKNLTDRRVSSVYNHFDIFDGGIYKRFVDSGQLVIKREANGEAKSPPGISDNIKDERRSIYDVRASHERRLEIIGVRVNKDKKL